MHVFKVTITIALFCLAPIYAIAQTVNIVDGIINTTHVYRYSHKPTRIYKHLVYQLSVPANTFAIIGVKRLSGTGDADATIARYVSSGTYEKASLSGIVTKSDNSGGNAELLIVGPTNTRQSYYLHLNQYNNDPGKWEISMEYFDFWEELGAAFGTSIAQHLLECLFTTCSNASPTESEQMAGRALGLAFAAVQSNSVCSFGVRAFANEIQAKVTEEFPGSQFIATLLNNFLTSFGGKIADVTC